MYTHAIFAATNDEELNGVEKKRFNFNEFKYCACRCLSRTQQVCVFSVFLSLSAAANKPTTVKSSSAEFPYVYGIFPFFHDLDLSKRASRKQNSKIPHSDVINISKPGGSRKAKACFFIYQNAIHAVPGNVHPRDKRDAQNSSCDALAFLLCLCCPRAVCV